jgi:hypothetical protein
MLALSRSCERHGVKSGLLRARRGTVGREVDWLAMNTASTGTCHPRPSHDEVLPARPCILEMDCRPGQLSIWRALQIVGGGSRPLP